MATREDSWIWEHYTKIDDLNAKCNLCPKTYTISKIELTIHAKYHLFYKYKFVNFDEDFLNNS